MSTTIDYFFNHAKPLDELASELRLWIGSDLQLHSKPLKRRCGNYFTASRCACLPHVITVLCRCTNQARRLQVKIKHLIRVGNSKALIIDQPFLEMLDIDDQTPLKMSVEGRKLVFEPVSAEEVEKRINKAADKVEKRFGRMFKRLAE